MLCLVTFVRFGPPSQFMTSGCPTRRTLAQQFAISARLYSESAVALATLGKSGVDYNRLRTETIRVQERSETALRAFTEHVDLHHCGEAMQNGQEHLSQRVKHVGNTL